VLPAIEEVFLAELVRSRLNDPKVTRQEAMKRLGITEADLDKITEGDYQVSTEEI
jgi:plasmid maintenance system antidote protein VapI